jgi:hypothetical protein
MVGWLTDMGLAREGLLETKNVHDDLRVKRFNPRKTG